MQLNSLLYPANVAVIGASDTPSKIGNVITKNLVDSGVTVFPVNPNEESVLGMLCYPSVRDIEGDVDVAVIAVSAKHIMSAIEDCLAKRVKFVIPVAGGFSEIGEAGKELQDEMVAKVKGTITRILGPNTVGIMIPDGLDTFFIPKERSPRPRQGSISLVSQSGSLMLGVYEKAEVEGVGIRACVGIGNKADLDEDDFLRHFANDPGTRCIAFYLESFENGGEFFAEAKEVAAHKSLVVAKVGVTEGGARAALSHTGALASGSDTLVSGMLRQCGAIRVRDERELLDASKALANVPPLAGDRIAVVGSAGGFGVVATDYVSSDVIGYGMRMAEFSEETKAGIRSISPYFASVENPIDLTGAVTDEMYDKALEVVNRDEGIDGIVLFLQFEPPGMTYALADVIIDWAKKGSKPMVVCCVGGSFPLPFMKRLDSEDIPTYGTIKRSIFALRCLYDRGRFLRRIGAL
jgi:acyl-CoA synthetase (NDP forming)